MDKFFNGKDIPWVNLVWEKHYGNDRLPRIVKKGSFWWRDVLKLLPIFKGMATVKINNGACFFWKDTWETQTLEQQFPQAFSFAKNKNITVRKAFSHVDITELFNLPVSQIAFDQLAIIQQKMNDVNLQQDSKDIWTYTNGTSTFKSGKAYKKLQGHHYIDPVFKCLWKSACQPKHKVFCWLLLKDRLSTKNILRRKQMDF